MKITSSTGKVKITDKGTYTTTNNKPQNKQDPIRWEFTQKEIEQMMHHLRLAYIGLEATYGRTTLTRQLRRIKKDWQRKIDWNRERGNWK